MTTISKSGWKIPKPPLKQFAAIIGAIAVFMIMAVSSPRAETRQATLLLKADTVIEISYISVEGGKEAQLMTDYLPKILPIVEKHGGKMLGSFSVSAVTGGEITPQMIVLFEWPSLEAREEMHADRDAQDLFPLRDDALTFFKQALFTVDEDTQLTLYEDKTYEFFNAWTTFAAAVSLPAYFTLSDAPKQRYGPPTFIASLKPLENALAGDYLLAPDMAGIVEWNNTAAYFGLIADPGFQLAAPLLSASVSRLDMVHTKFVFPQ